jgi:hypothetical protein
VLATPPNNEMQRTKHGQDGASPLISVLGGRGQVATCRHFLVESVVQRRSGMKVCPECKGKYSDTVTLCPKDGSALVPGEAIEPRKILLGIGFVIGAFLVGGLWLSLAVAVGVGIWLFLAFRRPPK